MPRSMWTGPYLFFISQPAPRQGSAVKLPINHNSETHRPFLALTLVAHACCFSSVKHPSFRRTPGSAGRSSVTDMMNEVEWYSQAPGSIKRSSSHHTLPTTGFRISLHLRLSLKSPQASNHAGQLCPPFRYFKIFHSRPPSGNHFGPSTPFNHWYNPPIYTVIYHLKHSSSSDPWVS